MIKCNFISLKHFTVQISGNQSSSIDLVKVTVMHKTFTVLQYLNNAVGFYGQKKKVIVFKEAQTGGPTILWHSLKKS